MWGGVLRVHRSKVRTLPGMSRIEIKYCTGCGAPVERQVRLRFCPYCGSKDEGKKFCAECGASLQDIPTSTPAVETAMPSTPMMQTTAVQPAATVMAQPVMPAQQAAPASASSTTSPVAWGGQPATTAKLAKAYCPDCGNEATWVSAYSQWYCYTDQKYVAQPSYTEPKKGLFRR